MSWASASLARNKGPMKLVAGAPLPPESSASLLEEGIFCGCEDSGLGGRATWEFRWVSWASTQSIQDQRWKWTLWIQAEKSGIPGTSAEEAKPLSQHQEIGTEYTGQRAPESSDMWLRLALGQRLWKSFACLLHMEGSAGRKHRCWDGSLPVIPVHW